MRCITIILIWEMWWYIYIYPASIHFKRKCARCHASMQSCRHMVNPTHFEICNKQSVRLRAVRALALKSAKSSPSDYEPSEQALQRKRLSFLGRHPGSTIVGPTFFKKFHMLHMLSLSNLHHCTYYMIPHRIHVCYIWQHLPSIYLKC